MYVQNLVAYIITLSLPSTMGFGQNKDSVVKGTKVLVQNSNFLSEYGPSILQ